MLCRVLQVSWYNEQIGSAFHLQQPPGSLAVLVISAPGMYDRAFLPFLEGLKERMEAPPHDPVDSCVAFYLDQAAKAVCGGDPWVVLHDYDVEPVSRRPRILVQTAAHVAGAAFYYQRHDLLEDPWSKGTKIYGVCMHPHYGGWFALRGAIFFPSTDATSLTRQPAPDCVPSQQDRVLLLEKFNFHWQDWTYRDVIPVEERYSEGQRVYFATPPAERYSLLGLPSPTSSPAPVKTLSATSTHTAL
uniref:cyanocobalamin reductase / alkylcobalamin dealkylase-like isoform X2 n=1 Tax=Myxine glutinosa TaxID=7769 RepID=UPI00358F3979